MSKIVNPFREDSAIATVFDMAVSGTTRNKIERYADRHDLNVHRIFHVLRTGEYGNSRWEYKQDVSGNVKLAPATSAHRKGAGRASSHSRTSTHRVSRAA